MKSLKAWLKRRARERRRQKMRARLLGLAISRTTMCPGAMQ